MSILPDCSTFFSGRCLHFASFWRNRLGPDICKRIIDQIGGEILVESEFGKGSTFRAIVPIGSLVGIKQGPAVWQPLATQQDQSPKNQPLAGLDCRILLAEDGPDNQRLLTLVLTKAGAQVTLAENGQAAVEKVLESMQRPHRRQSDRPFDVILMDMQMPVLDGYQATRRLCRRVQNAYHCADGTRHARRP